VAADDTGRTGTRATRRTTEGIRWVTILGGAAFLFFGLWAFAAPQSFFDSLATFEPYNPHLIRDIGGFQIGLGAVLLLVAFLPDPHGGALLGVGVGGAFHAVGHVLDRDLGGSPGTDIPTFALIAALLLWAGFRQLRVGP
jgi:hypothetical protein